jgi:predicted RNA binding protein YcfA (HicA-like mRNA interferase family)
MTRLPTLSARKIIQALEKAGFVMDRQRGSHYVMRHVVKNLTTCVPVHGKDVKRSLLKLILKQTDLSEDQFRKLL